jgi:molecular chaperone GrpE
MTNEEIKDSQQDINITENIAENKAEQESENQEQNSEASPELTEIEKLKAELAEAKDKYIRLYSEFDNFRKRTSKERLELISTASESIITALLPVLDDIERSNANLDKITDIEILKEGNALIFNKLHKILESKGLKPLQSKGEVFDADKHEAITQIPAPSDELKGKVVDEIEKGYILGEKLIRVAKVVIGA